MERKNKTPSKRKNTSEDFVGEYSCTLDDNNRLIIPSKFRRTINDTEKDMDEKLVAVHIYSKDFLTLYPISTWKSEIAARMRTLSHEDHDALLSRRNLGRRTAHIPVDKQGRISIPLNFYKAVGIEKNVILIGSIDMIQIGSPGKLGDPLIDL